MERERIEELFEESGYHGLNSRLAYKVWMRGVWDEEDEDRIEAFLDAYSFEGERILTDEFLYHYRIFAYIHEKNECSLFQRQIF
ncbi:hypothetical protein P2R12_10700 [Cytobacillus oceanisediminis]|uniref:hypothetical protein n=1 Tax=Cytobacillus oceanisediminis TaxID=665099 RepID=UPI0023DCA888|nr:hypothetical protein [Cytobacillus oceanisediminis]MDF2037419.1 hypothetical protein [Cytobacillus oceanisediminis]